MPDDASLSRSRLARLIVEGAVSVNGAVVTDARASVATGDAIEVRVEAAVESHIVGQVIPLSVVFEDADLIVIDKPAGMVVHPAPGSRDGTLVNALIAHCGDTLSGVGGQLRPGIVHRIDKDTSGLLVVAKSDRAHHGLAAQFAAHRVQRRYLAVCHGLPDQNDPRLHGIKGTSFEAGNILKIQTHLGRHKTDRQRQAVSFHGGRMLAGNRADASDPGASGALRPRPDRRSDLWRAAQTGSQGSGRWRGSGRAGVSPTGIARGDAGV